MHKQTSETDSQEQLLKRHWRGGLYYILYTFKEHGFQTINPNTRSVEQYLCSCGVYKKASSYSYGGSLTLVKPCYTMALQSVRFLPGTVCAAYDRPLTTVVGSRADASYFLWVSL